MGLLKEIKQQGFEVQIDPHTFIAKLLKTTVELWSRPGCPRSDLEPSVLTEVCIFCKVSHPLEVRVRQWLLLDNSVGRSQRKKQRMESLVKRHKRLNNQPKFG